ncbi:MAG: alpha/beta hydrolase [Atopobiaceae bacterium]|nr:alpha/beta hydrolase [Atopobiaceae bacterium]
MVPQIPVPYRTTTYAFPAAPMHYAQRIVMPDGADLATFVYGPQDASLAELLANSPVLALHGNGGSHATFAAVIDRLCAAGKGVIAFDGRAQGQSGRGTLPLTYELFAADALCVLDALGVSQTHVVGHSDGGIEALILARDHADRVLSIVAGGANITPEGVVEDPSWDTSGSAATNQAWAAFMDEPDLPAQVDPALLPQAQEARLSGELLQLMLDEPHIQATSLATISCPACVLVGEHDCIAWEETEAIASAIPGARLVVVPGVGHSLPRMAPDSVACQVLINIVLSN